MLFQVQKAAVMYDPHTRESRGFGFVTMDTAAEAEAAISALNGTDLKGRNLSIEKAGQPFMSGELQLTDIAYEGPSWPRTHTHTWSLLRTSQTS